MMKRLAADRIAARSEGTETFSIRRAALWRPRQRGGALGLPVISESGAGSGVG
jgi:hypothetical protein